MGPGDPPAPGPAWRPGHDEARGLTSPDSGGYLRKSAITVRPRLSDAAGMRAAQVNCQAIRPNNADVIWPIPQSGDTYRPAHRRVVRGPGGRHACVGFAAPPGVLLGHTSTREVRLVRDPDGPDPNWVLAVLVLLILLGLIILKL
jgi:hypothetical protein